MYIRLTYVVQKVALLIVSGAHCLLSLVHIWDGPLSITFMGFLCALYMPISNRKLPPLGLFSAYGTNTTVSFVANYNNIM